MLLLARQFAYGGRLGGRLVIIKSYGLFWRRDEIEWSPGSGARSFRLLGRQGKNRGTVRLVDARPMQGIYVLYGPHYVGLTRTALGNRLRDHTRDLHADSWDRFSWFGFQKVLEGCDDLGFCRLGERAQVRVTKTSQVIGDLEALLIKAMGLQNNKADMNFTEATEWTQVHRDETNKYWDKV
jgi:hypothetical protein